MSYNSHIKHFLFIFLFCFTGEIYTQGYSYKHYGVEDGLPSSEVYSAFQDSKGYMWFATDAGVSRFNGYGFENFDASDGLTDNTVFLITEDHKGRIWFGTFNCQLSYYEEGKIHAYKHNDKIKKGIGTKRAIISFVVDSLDNIWIGFYASGIKKIEDDGKVTQVIKIPEGIDWVNKVIQVDNKIVKGSFRSRMYDEKKWIEKSFNYKEMYEYKVAGINNVNPTRYFIGHKNSIIIPKGDSLISFFEQGIYLISREREWRDIYTSKKIKSRIYTGRADNKYIWLCVEKEGAYKCIVKNDSLQVITHFLDGKNISRVFKDNLGGLWFMSLEEGVYYLSNDEIKVVEKVSPPITAIETDTLTGELYIASNSKTIEKRVANDNYEIVLNQKNRKKVGILKFNYFDNSLILGYNDGLIQYHKNNKAYFKLINEGDLGALKSVLIDSNIIYLGNSFGITIIKGGEMTFNSSRKLGRRIWTTSLLKNGDNIWMGTNEGVRVFDGEKIVEPYEDNNYLSSAITSIARMNNNLILIGTKSYGILVVKDGDIIKVIGKKEGLISDLVKKIHIDNQQEIWVGTNKGLSRLVYQGDTTFSIYNLTPKKGLISGEVTSISSYKNIVYIATPKGLIEFDKTKIKENTIPPNVYITNFSVNTKHKNLDSIKELSYNENFIKITYEGLNYKSLGEVEYQYRMLGIDTNWTSTMTRSVQYPSLQYGEYTFEVKAKNEDEYWSEPTKISFTIQPPFWLTWWFIGLEIVIGLLIIYLIFKYREKQLIQKNESAQKIIEAEKKMVELELKALRSQMNPHFIFNTLNSIQHYIATNDFKSTNKYITQFARLIRTVLNLSEKNVITIQEEIEMLELYMNLERMRFDEEFEYEINISEEVDIDYDEIPSMLIQPYVENAIWHGLMNKKGKGKIKIEMLKEANYLCCTIEDNGIGRKKAEEIQATRKIKRKSVGMSITKERLDIINNDNVNIQAKDIEDKNGKVKGTKIEIKILYKS